MEVSENIEMDNAPTLARCLKGIREKHIAVGLSKVKEARTVLMAELIEEWQIKKKYGCKVVLYGLNQQARDVVAFSHVDIAISCYKTLDQALDYLRDGH